MGVYAHEYEESYRLTRLFLIFVARAPLTWQGALTAAIYFYFG